MSYEDILAIARLGETLSSHERTQLNDYVTAHPDRHSDIEFEKVLATTIINQPTVDPSLDFVDTLMSKLPVAPIHMPIPSLNKVWQWVASSVGAGAATSMAAWHWRDAWLGWLADTAPALVPEPGSITVGYYSFVGALGVQAPSVLTPTVIVGAMLALGAFAWGAVTFADETR